MESRSCLGFPEEVAKGFTFLLDLGFAKVDASATLVLYRSEAIEVDIYHGRKSYEVGLGVSALGKRYALSEIIRATDQTLASRWRNPVARSPEMVATALQEIAALTKHYARQALSGAPAFFAELDRLRQCWSEDYALDVLVDQLRPLADDAFRRGEYGKAAELYGRIRARLSPAETKKLILAEDRSRH